MGTNLKKLKSVKALEKEKALLLKERAELANFTFTSARSIESNKETDGGETDIVSEIVSLLPVSDSVAKIAASVVKMLFTAKQTKEGGDFVETKKKKKKKTEQSRKRENSVVLDIAYEVIGGYLKWKAIELSFKGIKYLIRKRKEKKSSERDF
jgi:hypothetical protein